MRPKATEKLMRLRAMSVSEIASRLETRVRSEAERVSRSRGSADPDGNDVWRFFHGSSRPNFRDRLRSQREPSCFKQYLKEHPAQRFYFPTVGAGAARLRNLVETRFPEWKRSAIEEAERLCEHRVEFLGYGEVSLSAEIDWHRDPLTGKRWPVRFWADYDLVRDAGIGDPKTIHELNRHQHLPRLAKAYFLTGEERYAREAVRQILGWIEQNPPGAGIHWHSSLEMSLRILSWLWTILWILPAASLGETASRRIGASLFAQVDHVCHYPSVFSSPNTHVLGEAAALYLSGALFPELERAEAWESLGSSLLLREMERQVSAEGIHNELSSYYHCYALDFYLQVLVLAMNNERVWPDSVWGRLAGMMEFLMHVTRPDGTIPLLGDDDGGRALALNRAHYHTFQDALCAGAVLYGRPDFKHVAGEFSEETLWLLGEKAWHIYHDLPSNPPRALQASYPASGYFVHRSGWDERASHLVFDAGQMGMIRGGHGHADALSVVLFAAGKELLVDPATSIYNSAPEWRNFFRSSQAHNTAVVDGIEQSEHGGTFHWRQVARTRLNRQISLAGIEYVEGEHDGYCRLPQKIVHRRGVLYCRPQCWVVIDRFHGEGRHRFDLGYHFPPEADVSLGGWSEAGSGMDVLARSENAALRLFLCSSAPQKAEIVSGRTQSIQGWASRRYGERRPAPAVIVSMESSAPAMALSILLPFHTNAPMGTTPRELQTYKMRQVETEAGLATACALECEDQEDLWIATAGEEEVKVMGYEMRGDFFWVRRDARGRKHLFAINASWFAEDRRPILHHDEVAPYVLLQWDGDDPAVERCNEGELPVCAEYAAS